MKKRSDESSEDEFIDCDIPGINKVKYFDDIKGTRLVALQNFEKGYFLSVYRGQHIIKF